MPKATRNLAPAIKVVALANKRAEILIHEAIGENWYGDGLTSKRFIEDLEALGDVEEILVRINSPGGAVFDGIAIYNALKLHPATKEVLVEGLAASAASFIAMCGDTIRMGAGSMMMIHNPWTFAIGDADDMREVADMLDKVGDSLVDIYHAKTRIERGELKTMLDAETWMTATEAVEKGFADIREGDDEAAEESAEAAASAHRAQFKKFADSCREAVAEIPLRVAAEIFKSAPADASAKETHMPQTAAASAKSADTPQNDQVQAAVQAALAAESERRSALIALFKPYGADFHDLQDACVNDANCSVEAARTKLLDALGARYTPTAGASNIRPGDDARDKFLAGAEKAILMRAGMEAREAGNEFYGMSLADLAAHALKEKGVSVRGMTKDGIARKVLASHSTSDFPLLLANTAGKVLRKAYTLAPVTWNRWCKVGSVSDFKQNSRITLGSFSSLLTKPERGEYQQGTVSEERETIQALTKGRYISLSREMIVNDDLGGFMDMSRKMGRAAARTVEADVYSLATSAAGAGPTMSDGGAFFNNTAISTAGGHANLGSATAITVAAIAAGEAAMMAQKDKGLNDFVVIQPRVLLCAPGKKQIAWEVVNSLTDVASSNANKKNYVQAQMNLEVVASPYLSGNAWYLFADPNDVEAFEVAFLDGIQEPFIDDEVEFMTDAMNMKVRLDYGVAAIDWRAGYRNPGA